MFFIICECRLGVREYFSFLNDFFKTVCGGRVADVPDDMPRRFRHVLESDDFNHGPLDRLTRLKQAVISEAVCHREEYKFEDGDESLTDAELFERRNTCDRMCVSDTGESTGLQNYHARFTALHFEE